MMLMMNDHGVDGPMAVQPVVPADDVSLTVVGVTKTLVSSGSQDWTCYSKNTNRTNMHSKQRVNILWTSGTFIVNHEA